MKVAHCWLECQARLSDLLQNFSCCKIRATFQNSQCMFTLSHCCGSMSIISGFQMIQERVYMHWKYYKIPRIIRLIKSVFSDLVLVGSQEILKWIWAFFFFGFCQFSLYHSNMRQQIFCWYLFIATLRLAWFFSLLDFFFLEKKNLMACMTCIIEQIL